MAKQRSPNYPALGLSEAVTLIRQVYDKEKRSQSASEIVAKALGYSGLSGNVRVKIATLKKYGLLDGDEKKGLRVSDLAMQILYPENGLSHSDGLKKAALSPALFQMIYTEKKEASDGALVNHLVSKLDFSATGATQAIASYRDAIKTSGLDVFGYNEDETPSQAEAPIMQSESQSASAASPQAATTGLITWTWPLSIPRNVKAELRITGALQKGDIARLKKQVESLEEAFEDGAQ